MTDARLRGEWLRKTQFEDLSDEAWRVFTLALMWSNESGTDGRIPARQLRRLYPFGLTSDEAIAEIAAAGLWTVDEAGNATTAPWKDVLGQSYATEVEAKREANRARARKAREKQASSGARPGPAASTGKVAFDDAPIARDVTRDVTRDVQEHVQAHVGIGLGPGPGSVLEGKNLDESRSASGPITDWPVAPIGIGALPCAVPGCNVDVSDYPASSFGVCSGQDNAHNRFRESQWPRSA